MPHIDQEHLQRQPQWYPAPYSFAEDEQPQITATKAKDLWREAVSSWHDPDRVQANIGRVQQYAKKCYQIAFDERFIIWVEMSVIQPGPTMYGVALSETRPYLHWVGRALEYWLSTAPREGQALTFEPPAFLRESFLSRAIRLDKNRRTDSALDLVYEAVDEMLRRGQLEHLNSILEDLDVTNCSTDVLLAVLTSTLPARTKLTKRRSLLEKVKNVLHQRGEDVDALLVGLET